MNKMDADGEQDPRYSIHADAGVLRTRLVAALAGVTPNRLSRWHRNGLLEAHTLPGGPGTLRLYSWLDYMKARAARGLLEAGVKPTRLKQAIAYLEETTPDWPFIPLHEFRGQVLLNRQGLLRTAGHASQFAIPEVVQIHAVLTILEHEGPLGTLHSYSDVIDMDPRILGGNPRIKDTRLEARFVAELAARGAPREKIAQSYRLTPYQVDRAIAFTDRIAA